MIKSRIAVAGALLAVAGAANAGSFTVTPTITSDYDFRGLSQTDEDPAFQLGATYNFDNGFYAGLWGSNVDLGDADIEVDAFFGYAGGDAEESFGYDLGAVVYVYPSSDADEVVEVYAGLSKGMFSGKLWFSPDVANESAFYVEGNATFPLPAEFSLLAHVGYSTSDAYTDYLDYSIGVGRNFGPVNVSLKYVDVSESVLERSDTEDKFILSATTTLPWAK